MTTVPTYSVARQHHGRDGSGPALIACARTTDAAAVARQLHRARRVELGLLRGWRGVMEGGNEAWVVSLGPAVIDGDTIALATMVVLQAAHLVGPGLSGITWLGAGWGVAEWTRAGDVVVIGRASAVELAPDGAGLAPISEGALAWEGEGVDRLAGELNHRLGATKAMQPRVRTARVASLRGPGIGREAAELAAAAGGIDMVEACAAGAARGAGLAGLEFVGLSLAVADRTTEGALEFRRAERRFQDVAASLAVEATRLCHTCGSVADLGT